MAHRSTGRGESIRVGTYPRWACIPTAATTTASRYSDFDPNAWPLLKHHSLQKFQPTQSKMAAIVVNRDVSTRNTQKLPPVLEIQSNSKNRCAVFVSLFGNNSFLLPWFNLVKHRRTLRLPGSAQKSTKRFRSTRNSNFWPFFGSNPAVSRR
jgi:hypothetical protein